VRRAQQLQVQLRFVMENEDPNTVFWIERRAFRGAPGAARRKSSDEKQASGRTNVFLQATPIEVGQILRECLWSKLETSVLTSPLWPSAAASTTSANALASTTPELIVASHFDYESQAILFVPPDLPDPRTPEFVGKAVTVIRQLLEITRDAPSSSSPATSR